MAYLKAPLAISTSFLLHFSFSLSLILSQKSEILRWEEENILSLSNSLYFIMFQSKSLLACCFKDQTLEFDSSFSMIWGSLRSEEVLRAEVGFWKQNKVGFGSADLVVFIWFAWLHTCGMKLLHYTYIFVIFVRHAWVHNWKYQNFIKW